MRPSLLHLACAGALAALSACSQEREPSVSAGTRDIVRETLANAPQHGFGANLFQASDAQLGAQIIAYANAQHGTDRDPRDVDANWGIRGAPYNAVAEFNKAQASNTLPAWLASLPPPAPQYEALRRAYVRYQQIAANGGWPNIPAGAPLKLGSADPRVATLRQRLAVESQTPLAATPRFDAQLVQALKAAQLRFGINHSGILDETTRAALNVSAQTRLTQIKANLQRWRWAPREPAPTRIEVNVPSGVAIYYVDNKPSLSMRVAVGRPGDETPMLTSKITSIVFDPPWNVPDSIAQKELLPKAQADPTYLERNNFIQQDTGGQTRLIQQPGPQSALGLVKFVFDNRYGVYLHDTPAKAAFAQAQRSVSHGCVRLERAIDLAKAVLTRQGWSSARVDQAIAAGATSEVKLAAAIPVQLNYWTAWSDGRQVYFRDDIYGWDQSTARLADGVVEKPIQIASVSSSAAPPDSAAPPRDDISQDDPIPAQRFDDFAAQNYSTANNDEGSAADDNANSEEPDSGPPN